MSKRRAGIIQLIIDGQRYDAKGNFTYNLGRPMREALIGSDRPHGFRETPQIGFIEGEITDRDDLDLEALVTAEDATCTLNLANGKVVVLREAYFAADGNVGTDEANITFRMEGEAEEIR
jgi:hypothetical protein